MTRVRRQNDWYKRYPGRFLAGTRGMPALQFKVYARAIDGIYEAGRPLDYNDVRGLANLLDLRPQDVHPQLQKLIDAEKLYLTEDGMIGNALADAVIAQQPIAAWSPGESPVGAKSGSNGEPNESPVKRQSGPSERPAKAHSGGKPSRNKEPGATNADETRAPRTPPSEQSREEDKNSALQAESSYQGSTSTVTALPPREPVPALRAFPAAHDDPPADPGLTRLLVDRGLRRSQPRSLSDVANHFLKGDDDGEA